MTFQVGESGNPSGRPKGIIDRRSKFRGLLEAHAETIIQKLVENAKVGDPVALRLCVERLLPRIKPDSGIDFPLPDGRIDAGANMLQIANDLVQAVASGVLTLEEAVKFSGFLKAQRWAINEAERKVKEEVEAEERRQYWEARRKERDDSSEDS
jgi:hypothetical protein